MSENTRVPNGEFLLYQSEDGRTKLDVRLEDQTVWLNQKQLADLFGKAKGTISEHIKHIFEDEELAQEATVRLFRIVQKEGDRKVVREVEFYKLDHGPGPGFPSAQSRSHAFSAMGCGQTKGVHRQRFCAGR